MLRLYPTKNTLSFTIGLLIMKKHTYGISTDRTGYIDVSNTLLGAKQHATRNGYDKVYVRYDSGYVVALVAEKIQGKWIKKN